MSCKASLQRLPCWLRFKQCALRCMPSLTCCAVLPSRVLLVREHAQLSWADTATQGGLKL